MAERRMVRYNNNGDGLVDVQDITDKELTKSVAYLKNLGNVVWTNGCFDMLHVGHLGLFRHCRRIGYTIVGVNSNESANSLRKSHPLVNDELDRATLVASLKDVDMVIVFDEPTTEEVLHVVRPSHFIKGGDYTVDQLPEGEVGAVRAYGGQVAVCKVVPGKSTTSTFEKIKEMVTSG